VAGITFYPEEVNPAEDSSRGPGQYFYGQDRLILAEAPGGQI